jgi:hypothetical protein
LFAAYNDAEAESEEVNGDATIILNKSTKKWEVDKYCVNATRASSKHYKFHSKSENNGKNLAMRRFPCMYANCLKDKLLFFEMSVYVFQIFRRETLCLEKNIWGYLRHLIMKKKIC